MVPVELNSQPIEEPISLTVPASRNYNLLKESRTHAYVHTHLRLGSRETTDGVQVTLKVQTCYDLALLFGNFSLSHPFIDSAHKPSVPQIGEFSLEREV